MYTHKQVTKEKMTIKKALITFNSNKACEQSKPK